MGNEAENKTNGEKLLAAVTAGRIAEVKAILSHYYSGAAGATDDEGNTALHLAAANKSDRQAEIIAELITRKLKMSALNKDKKTPLHVAIAAGNVAATKLLLEHGNYSFFADNDHAVTLLQELANAQKKFLLKDYAELYNQIITTQARIQSQAQLQDQTLTSSVPVEQPSSPLQQEIASAEAKSQSYHSRAKVALSLILLSSLGLLAGLALLPIWPVAVPVIGASLLGAAIVLGCSAALWLGATVYSIYAQRVAKQAQAIAMDLQTQLNRQITNELEQAYHRTQNKIEFKTGLAAQQEQDTAAQAALAVGEHSKPAGKVFVAAPPHKQQVDLSPDTVINPEAKKDG